MTEPTNPYAAPQNAETTTVTVAATEGPQWYRYAWFLPLALSGCALLVAALGESGHGIGIGALILFGGLVSGWVFTIAAFIHSRGHARRHARAGALVSSILTLMIGGLLFLFVAAIHSHTRYLQDQERRQRQLTEAESQGTSRP